MSEKKRLFFDDLKSVLNSETFKVSSEEEALEVVSEVLARLRRAELALEMVARAANKLGISNK